MMVRDEEFNNRTDRLVNVRATSPDLYPVLCGCPASHDQVNIVNLDGTQPTSTSGF
jgi:hypothetical protein